MHELEKALDLRKQTKDELRRLNAELTSDIGGRKQAENVVNEQGLAMIFENEKSALPCIIHGKKYSKS